MSPLNADASKNMDLISITTTYSIKKYFQKTNYYLETNLWLNESSIIIKCKITTSLPVVVANYL